MELLVKETDLTEIYRATLAKWGEEAQYDQMVEECAELIAGLKHFKRDKVGTEAIINELADVTLMVGQLTWMFGPDRVEAAMEAKLKKLRALLAVPEAR
ncbi:antitoxin [Geothermobacter hydrogeniphilus]|uniref:Antitoxin n=1 Tax=Geothermobacter hydrogeniphilus TaxID=1969733 RepID=A0A2K2HC15_9BACT|nr:antitoxin [Geothermobacter hydrogeniphilus]